MLRPRLSEDPTPTPQCPESPGCPWLPKSPAFSKASPEATLRILRCEGLRTLGPTAFT